MCTEGSIPDYSIFTKASRQYLSGLFKKLFCPIYLVCFISNSVLVFHLLAFFIYLFQLLALVLFCRYLLHLSLLGSNCSVGIEAKREV